MDYPLFRAYFWFVMNAELGRLYRESVQEFYRKAGR